MKKPNATPLGKNSKIIGKKIKLGASVKLGKGATIKGQEIKIEDNVTIGDNTKISARRIFIGFGTEIENDCTLSLAGMNSTFCLRDNCFIGHDSKVLVPLFETGDYVTLNNHLFVNGFKPCTLGHNVWVGQNCILNARDKLTIGNGVGIGTYNCIWTHGAHGELLEGCRIFKVAPVTIEDDVWLIGSFNVVSPGVTLGEKSVVLTGSVVTKDVPPQTCVAGNPARDITDRVQPYQEISLDEKYEKMKEFINEFVSTYYPARNRKLKSGWRLRDSKGTCEIAFIDRVDDKAIRDGVTGVIFTKKNEATRMHEKTSIFDLSSKKYTKKRTEIEVEIMRFLLYPKARFYPQ